MFPLKTFSFKMEQLRERNSLCGGMLLADWFWVISEAGSNNAFYYFRYDRKARDWAIVRKRSYLFKVDFLSSGEMTDSLSMG